MRLKLITTKKTHKYTEGILFNLDTNEKICDTLEDTIRDINDNGVFDNGESKQYGETAILSGVYNLVVHFSNSFQKEVVMLQETPSFTYIYLHYGKTVENTLGCILVGEKTKDGELKNIGMTDKFVEMLKNSGSGSIEIVR